MKFLNKGEYGYRSFYKIKMGMMVGFFLFAIIVQYLASKWVTQEIYRNILTVMAILTVLPMANLAAPWIATIQYKTPNLEEYQKLLEFSNRGAVVSDLVITMREQIFPVDFAIITNSHVVLYIPFLKLDKKRAKRFIQENFKFHSCNMEVIIYLDFKEFEKEVEKLEIQEGDEKRERAIALLKSLSV